MEVKPGYKQTEAGVIPEDWKLKLLPDVAEITNGKAHEQFIVNQGKYVVVNAKFISSDGRVRKFTNKNVCPAKKGNIIFVMSDVPNGKALAKCFLVDADDSYAVNQSVCSFRVRKDDSTYLFYFLNRNAYFLKFDDGIQQTHLLSPVFRRCPVVLPSRVEEQRAIARALSDVDALLRGLDRLIAKKRDLKQAAMQQLLTGETRLPGFHGEWTVKQLGDVAIFYKGKGLPKSALSVSGAEPCIHYGELFTRYPETIGEIFSRTDNSAGAFRSIANDVLMPTSDVTPRGLAKASCIRVDGVILGGDILVIRSDTKLVFGAFLSWLIRYEEAQVLQLVTGSTVFHLYGSDMKKFTFSLPPVPEQAVIAEVLTEMDAELTALEKRREKTRALRQAMMQELLTGKTRLV
jgi:type I restriction enzyme, S subunit